MESEVKLRIVGLVYNQTVVGTYGLVLSEEEGNRRFSIMIGEPEAQSIALKLNNRKSPRPLSHDLIHDILHLFDASLQKIVIYSMVNDVFYSELHIMTNDVVQILDARTSDAVALAVRSGSPIFIKSDVLDVVGSVVENQPTSVGTQQESINVESMSKEDLDILSLDKLRELLDMSLKEEKYELAVTIRDVIKHKHK